MNGQRFLTGTGTIIKSNRGDRFVVAFSLSFLVQSETRETLLLMKVQQPLLQLLVCVKGRADRRLETETHKSGAGEG